MRPSVRLASVSFDTDEAVLRLDGDPELAGAVLVGRRARVPATESSCPLLLSRWGSQPLALPTDTYRLVLPDGSIRVTFQDAPTEIRHPLFHATVRSHADGLVVDVRAPLSAEERGRQAQRALERAYRRRTAVPEDAVFLESYRGRTAACNPRGIDRALAELRPSTTRYWSVVDGSVAVPPGSERIIEGTEEWWRVRGSARVLVVNDWLRTPYRPRPHQHVLQTWHGSTLKRLARDRADVGLRTRIASKREGGRWDALLAQNEFSAQHLRSAYAFRGPIWVEGYPRNDILLQPELATQVRHRLGLDEQRRVVLYAPTWREDRTEMVDHLDPAAFARDLGPDHVVLVRGHSSTWEHGSDHAAPGVLDVTGYPDVSDLLLVSDVLVTDYSSVMFDWLSTGRPAVFHVPDLARYRSELRGFYEDLLADAPGPVTTTDAELVDAVRAVGERAGHFDDVRAAWRERFASHDDGTAGRRVAQTMLDAGWFGES